MKTPAATRQAYDLQGRTAGARRRKQYEPEGHTAVLCEITTGLISGQFPASVEQQRETFERHLAPWIGRFFADLEVAESANFYRRVGSIGCLSIEIERTHSRCPFGRAL